MTRDDVEKLLGGYATGTLTAQERALLFEAALADQALFNALADEQALKELLDNPHARRRLLTALRVQASRPSVLSRLRHWLLPPAVRAVAGGLAVALLAVTTVTRLLDIVPPPSEVTEDTHRAEPARGRAGSVDKLMARKHDLAPKKGERQEPLVALEKAIEEADVKQNNDAERQAATAPLPDTKRSEGPSAAAAPESKTAPATQPPATAAVGVPVPSQQLMARAEADRPAEIGAARDLFYGTGARRKDKETADQSAEGLGSARDEIRKSAPPETAKEKSVPSLPDERITGLGGLARQAIQRLGIRYTLRQSEPLGLVESGPALLTVEVNQDAYLHIHASDASGATYQLLPLQAGDPALVQRGRRYYIPLMGSPPVHAVIALYRSPRSKTDGGSRTPTAGEAPLREEVNETRPDGVSETWVYLVETSPSPTSSLSVEIVVPVR